MHFENLSSSERCSELARSVTGSCAETRSPQQACPARSWCWQVTPASLAASSASRPSPSMGIYVVLVLI